MTQTKYVEKRPTFLNRMKKRFGSEFDTTESLLKPGDLNKRNQEWQNQLNPIRVLLIVIHSGAITYTTYRTFLESERFVPWQRDPIQYPSWASEVLQRGKDTTDIEWGFFVEVFFWKVLEVYAAYVVASQCVLKSCPSWHPTFASVSTFGLLYSVMGAWPATCLYFLPVVYWAVLRLKSRLAVWAATGAFLIGLGSQFSETFIRSDTTSGQYYFRITCAWSIARCISYCFDTMQESDCCSLQGLKRMVQYVNYLPLTLGGPLVLYKNFRIHMLQNVQKPAVPKSWTRLKSELDVFLLKLLRVAFWTLAIEVMFHYLYFWPLALTPSVLNKCSWWTLCGVVFWLGCFFQMKYVVFYGIPTAIAEFDGMPMPRLPRCIAYVHRYSVLWKDFDRGLYDFLVTYTYLPTCEALQKSKLTCWWNQSLLKLLASVFTFGYVYLWHGTDWEIFVWAFFNFVGMTAERIGSGVRRKIDSRLKLTSDTWDVLIEPVATIPLAIMSVINSAVFCGTLETARIVTYRFFTEKHWIVPYFYIVTHIGVAVRYWGKNKKS